MSDLPDPRRIIGNILRLGTIESVDLGEATCRVRVGDNVTGDIPWLAPRAGELVRIWSPPSVGEQCLLFCAEGDTEAGIAVTGLFSDAHPAPSSDPLVMIAFKDGTQLSYDPEAHALKIEIAAGGTAEMVAPGGLTITADTVITGDVQIAGSVEVSETVTASDDVIGGGKSLKSHKHTGVQAGGAQSGPPA
jgi:phage baseplate assembly protein V